MSAAPSRSDLHDALHRHFGHADFRAGQEEAVRAAVEGRDGLVVMPTGAGKSLCFQLPALIREGTTLVISPLIALMKDQVDALQASGVAATFINSSLDATEQAARLSRLAAGDWQLCYIAPERLRQAGFRQAARRATVAMVAVDEAHCISQWGHDFRPEYCAIGDFVSDLGRPPLLALTATATPQVQQDIEQQLVLRHPFRLVTGFNRPNLRFEALFAPGDTAKQQALKRLLDEQPPEACGVIYVGRRREAGEVAAMVKQLCGRRAVVYHAGLPGWEREKVQNEWMAGEAPIVVATNAFGMGVDKPDVRFVIHYTLPGTLEAYYQEAGRAGRDGQDARCVILYDPGDTRLHEWFIENDAPSLEELRQLYGFLRDEGRRSGGGVTSSFSQLTMLLDMRVENKLRVGMKLLEETGLIAERGEVAGMTTWRLLPVQGRVDMLEPLRNIEARRAQKRRLLAAMTDYAHSHDCRRQYLLDYFGDATPPVAPWCCDNCQRPPASARGVAVTAEDRAMLSILDAVHNLSYGIGRALLAKLLAGSRSGGMDRYFTHPQFGILRHVGMSGIRQRVDELIRERYLVIQAGPYPTLALSEAGRQAVAQRLALGVAGVESAPLPSARPPAERVTDTVEATRLLHEEGLSIEAIAMARGLTIGTVYNHLAELIAQGRVPIHAVVSEAVREEIEQAVAAAGSFFLSPIKALLPEELSYGEVRCVVAWMRYEGREPEARPSATDQEARHQRLVAWRDAEARRCNEPAYSILSNTILQALAASAPTTPDELAALPYLRAEKRERYGAALLAAIADPQEVPVGGGS